MATHFLGGLAMRPVSVPDAATYTVLAKNSGKVHIIPDLTADCTITLPSAENGLSYRFMYAGAGADVQDWIINTAATTSLYKGGVIFADQDSDAAGDEIGPVFANGSTHDTMNVFTPSSGTHIDIVSDGTHWYVTGIVLSVTIPTFV